MKRILWRVAVPVVLIAAFLLATHGDFLKADIPDRTSKIPDVRTKTASLPNPEKDAPIQKPQKVSEIQPAAKASEASMPVQAPETAKPERLPARREAGFLAKGIVESREMALPKPPERTQTAPPVPQAAPPATQAKVEPGPIQEKEEAYLVAQIGTYQVRQNAEALRDQLAPRVGKREIKISRKGRAYLVLITGFKDRKEALDLMKELGLSYNLIQGETPGD